MTLDQLEASERLLRELAAIPAGDDEAVRHLEELNAFAAALASRVAECLTVLRCRSMMDDTRAEQLEATSARLQRLMDEAQRIQRELAEHLEALRGGGKGDHTHGKPPQS